MLPRSFSFRVVGVSYSPTYPANLERLLESAQRRWLFAPGGTFGAGTGPEPEEMPAVLVRRPDNTHDPNAVEVHVPEVGMVGHVPAQGHARLAERLAASLDAGELWQATVREVQVHPDHPDRPGIVVAVRFVEGVEE